VAVIIDAIYGMIGSWPQTDYGNELLKGSEPKF
jgi:hypothetical protein